MSSGDYAELFSWYVSVVFWYHHVSSISYRSELQILSTPRRASFQKLPSLTALSESEPKSSQDFFLCWLSQISATLNLMLKPLLSDLQSPRDVGAKVCNPALASRWKIVLTKNFVTSPNNNPCHDEATIAIPVKGQTMPKFGLSWCQPGDGNANTIAAFEPIFGKRIPDVGPLNMRIVAWASFAIQFFVFVFSIQESVSEVWDRLLYYAEVPDQKKQKEAKKTLKKPLKLVEKPVVLNTYGTISANLGPLFLSQQSVMFNAFYCKKHMLSLRSFRSNDYCLRLTLKCESKAGPENRY